jgi:diguanylate cyclase (GGDEF)-like protein
LAISTLGSWLAVPAIVANLIVGSTVLSAAEASRQREAAVTPAPAGGVSAAPVPAPPLKSAPGAVAVAPAPALPLKSAAGPVAVAPVPAPPLKSAPAAVAVGAAAALPLAPTPARALRAAKAAAPARLQPTFPSADPLLRAMDRIASAVDASTDGDLIELSAQYQKRQIELDRAAVKFAAAAKAAGEAPPARFIPTIKSYSERGDDLLKLAAARRVAMAEYSSHFEQLNTRVKKSLDKARKTSGGTVARQSLAKLTGNLDDLRLRYADVASADTVDSPTLDALGVSEAAVAQALAQDRDGYTHAESQGWYTKSLGDLHSMSAARKSLLRIDKQRKDGARRFGDDSVALSRIVGEMGKTEIYDARLSGSPVASSAVALAGAAPAVAGGDARRPSPAAVDASDSRQGASTTAVGTDARSGVPIAAAGGDSPRGVSVPVVGADARGTVPVVPADRDSQRGASATVAAGPDAAGATLAAGGDTPPRTLPAGGADAGDENARQVTSASSPSSDSRPASSPTAVGVDSERGEVPPAADVSFAASDAASNPASPGMQGSVTTTTLEPQNDSSVLVAWIIGGVLLLALCIVAAIARSIVRTVRRLSSATLRIAKGESDVIVPRGGIRELDTLALTIKHMAAQLAAAEEAVRNQQHLLETKIAERTLELQELAQLDTLTRLPNRRHFFELLNAAIENATRENRFVGVFFLDIDNFKNMNDSLGHEFGDQVLQAIAQRLAESTRSFGFAARLGGDEFTVAYESASGIEDIRIAGLQLIQAFQEPILLEDRELVVSLSAGASVYPDHAQHADALLRAADAALYQAKAIGRSQLALFTPALLETSTARFATEQGLRRAIERGEFDLVFQPEVNLQTCEIEVVEALLRWRLPDGHYASPGDFFAVAESSGLILQINDWVIRRAIETVAHWRHGVWPAARVAINVSSPQLFDNTFVEQLLALLAEYKLPPTCIEIELTENVLQTGSATIASLHRLHAHGIAIALDDFGTGFSSLASLEQLPLSRIKLDRSLIASIDTKPRSATIARAIIQLCQGLGLSVTAEGIERPEQLAPLVGYAGLHAQGYLLAHPQHTDQLLQVMATLPTLARALVRASVARLPESQLAESLPFVTAASED